MSKANEALDKMAENARELGLDYEPTTKQALTKEEIEEAWEESKGAPNRLKAFYDLLDDKLWRKNKLRQYKENT